VALFGGLLDTRGLMVLALVAYAAYAVNAIQFVLKLRRARMETARAAAGGLESATAGSGRAR
jgi:3-vinyl bacteriochlorophyllide hydratase